MNKKGVSPVLSVLLMIIVAVAASLVTYAWVMGYIGFTTAKAGKAIQIQSIANGTSTLMVYVQNVGDGYVDLKPSECLYVNGIIQNVTLTGVINNRIEPGGTATLTLTPINLLHGQTLKVKAVTVDGTFNEKSYTVP